MSKNAIKGTFLYYYTLVPHIKGIIHMSGNTNSTSKSPFFQYFMGACPVGLPCGRGQE